MIHDRARRLDRVAIEEPGGDGEIVGSRAQGLEEARDRAVEPAIERIELGEVAAVDAVVLE